LTWRPTMRSMLDTWRDAKLTIPGRTTDLLVVSLITWIVLGKKRFTKYIAMVLKGELNRVSG
jgi:hypothetical protein